ncbi:hypothetical protein OIU79_002743 [Salix purpurea]|uniref:Uncharacterized protein n=1 Tax=Salix purpurea TaxID=77065 RepID=A0A9Q0UK56_SALPP|nr:hypothetical protein OIU79_002743 [Salix purpurea]
MQCMHQFHYNKYKPILTKGKDKVEGDSDCKNHGRMICNRKESHNKLTQTDNMQVTTSICSVIRGNTLLVQKPMKRNRESEPPDEDVWMDEGHVMAANGTKGETMEGIEKPVGVNLLEEWEVRKDNP